MTEGSEQIVPAPDGQSPPLAVAAAPGLWQIPLPQPLPGFDEFISAWLITSPATVLVDVGPAASVPRLFEALSALGVDRIDAVLLTHIHLDHAGGAGDFAVRFPHAPVVCHHSALSHLADPSRLWAGSLKALGDTARAYGPMRPVPEPQLVDADTINLPDLAAIATPGHAVHHVSYRVGPFLMAGEASGVYQRVDDGTVYLRPATPPRFFLETSLASIDLLLPHAHALTCFGHHGWCPDGQPVLRTHRAQLLRWADIISARMSQRSDPTFEDGCIEALLAQDPLLTSFQRLSPAVRQREGFFLRNSIRGFVQYLAAREEGTAPA
ncbi:MAG: MBL fold metallo-hydrolase [Desulfobacterales bacterium]|nr:MBL fold metallo-hydrolase [Desulfobacterales bacterium]